MSPRNEDGDLTHDRRSKPAVTTKPYWDQVADAWRASDRDQLWRSLSDAIHLHLLDEWAAWPVGAVALKTDLFDEAASGRLGRELAARATLLVGMDLSPYTAQAAARRAPQAALLVADVRSLPLADSVVDAIISNSTLDHLDSGAEIRATLLELTRVLADGGSLLVTLDNPQQPLVWLRQRLPWTLLHRLRLAPYRYGPTLALAELTAACRCAGLTVVETGALVHCPRVLAIWIGRALHRLGVRHSAGYERLFLLWERLGRWPTRLATGRFVAVLARKDGALLATDGQGGIAC